jgi:mono/diheme cytochrome c family protein
MPARTASLRALLDWALVAVVVLAACGTEGAAVPDGTAGAEVASGDGAAAFTANCAMCHGPVGDGTDQGPPLVHIVYEPSHHGDDAFRRAVAQGVTPHHWDFGPMPPQPQVGSEELEAIIAHVRALQRDAGIE